MSKRNIFVIFLIDVSIVFSTLLVCFCAKGTVPKDESNASQNELHDCEMTVSKSNKNLVLEFIELQRRNWENHGTDIRINKEGAFIVTAKFLGKSKKVREGTIAQQQLEYLIRSIEDANLFALQDEYKAPFKTLRSWWGYQLIIETQKGTKSIRFHSEDETVPEVLNKIVKDIMELTK